MDRPDQLHRPSGQTWTVGDVVVHRIDEIIMSPQTGAWILPTVTPEVVTRQPWLRAGFAAPDGTLRLASQSFAFETGGLRVLVDTGIGNGKTRTNPAWHRLDTDYLQRLTAAGFPPETVDLVLLTHLHTDHVGWNTRAAGDGSWTPTFPRARYLTSRTEWDYWAGMAGHAEEGYRQVFGDSLQPVHDAGLLDLADMTNGPIDIAPGIRLLPTPGHTPGQIAVELRSAGRSAVITGDFVHHPVQLAHPDITSRVDTDPDQAVRTRRDLLAALAGTDVLLLGSHFPPPTAGHVIADNEGYRLLPSP